ncbi:Replication-associated recombination protein A [bacterium HR23]|nr:Replication-associated recombination protein A [bacterium HR23]
MHLRNPVTPLMKGLGYGQGYRYAHDYPGHFAPQDYLPSSLRGRRYYEPSEEGLEREIAERLRRWWKARGQPEGKTGPDATAPPTPGPR